MLDAFRTSCSYNTLLCDFCQCLGVILIADGCLFTLLMLYLQVMRPVPKTATALHASSSRDGQHMGSLFARTLADTTWRIFVPVTLFVGLGLWFDLTHSATKPWVTVAGLIVGFILAGLLINRQLRRARS